MSLIVFVILACLAAPAAPRYTCAAFEEQIAKELRAVEAHPVALATPARMVGGEGAGQRCDDFERAVRALDHPAPEAERGTIGGRRAAVWTDGPHGSGHFSTVTLAVELDGRRVGACFTTSTSGWRNLSEVGHRGFGAWHTLVDGRLLLWDGVVAGAAEYESLLSALVYRLRGDVLALDRAATLREIGRMGRVYANDASARPGDDEALAMHRAAAAAYRALAGGAACP
jgi:hypothetical protein